MLYRVLAEVTMVVHFAFLAYLTLGGFLAWRWKAAIVPHVVTAAWGAVVIALSLRCPLTPVEGYFRRAVGQAGLERGFIDTYLEGVVYPEHYVNLVRLGVAIVVLISWTGAWLRWRRTAPTGTGRPDRDPARVLGAQ